MLANYKELGFHICAEVFPEACTFCPFWWYVVTDNTGRCEITGRRIEATGCQRRCNFVIFRRTWNVRKWRVKVCSL